MNGSTLSSASATTGPPPAETGPLEFFFSPKTVAVIGATEKPASVGRAVLENLSAFDGAVYPVNPRHATVLGRSAFPTISAVPQPVDLAVIVTPAPTVPGLVRECMEAGVKAAVIISAGFRECGAAGAELEQQVLAAARLGGLRVIGPNCLGVMAPHDGLNATFAATAARPGSVSFLSQSGALCTAMLDWSRRENVGFSALVSVGSMLDVGWGDLIRHFGRDPQTRSIVIYMESVGDASAFLSAAREVACVKPIVVLKVGRTAAAARAAASHTGALTGSDEVADAAFRRAGILRAETSEDLFDLVKMLAMQPAPRGPRLAIVTNAGGPGALAADALVMAGGRLAPLAPATIAALGRALPPHWSRSNPVDVLGDADAERYARALELVAHDPAADGVLVILTPQAMTDATAIAEKLRTFAAAIGTKPLLASWMGGTAVEAGETLLRAAGIPTFAYPDRAARAFAGLWCHRAMLAALDATPESAGAAENERAPHPLTEKIIMAARERGRTVLSEHESKQILAEHGIPVAETFLATTEDEAAELAARLGFPVALKLHSETITHKSAVGGVRLDVRDAGETRRAWREIKQAAENNAGARHFLGVAVQRMVATAGHELILGSSTDPQFGPVLLFGAGGRLVEVMRDRALGLPPLNAALARRLMEQTKIFRALQGGVKGRPAADLPALETILVRFSQLVGGQRRIREIDINPLLVSGGQAVALDARIILHDPGLPDELLPRLALTQDLPGKCQELRSHSLLPVLSSDRTPENQTGQTLNPHSMP
jgi:acetyltransferase